MLSKFKNILSNLNSFILSISSIAFISSISFIPSLRAQPFVDILNIQYQRFPGAPYDSANASLITEQVTANLFLPLQLKNKDVIVLGSSFDKFRFRYWGASDSIRSKTWLYATSLQLGGIKQWKDGKWSALMLIIPRISSDWKKLSKKHYQLGGVVLFTYTKNSTLKYKFGLYYNREFFGNFFMPLAGFEWKVNEKLNIFGVLPGSMNVEYKLNKSLYTGIAYKSITTSYRLSDSTNNYYVREGHRFWGHWQLKGFINYYAVKNVALFAEFGGTSWRRYEVYKNGRENKKDPVTEPGSFYPVYRNFKNGVFFNVGIALRVRLEN
ncbi:MAG: hypothetical protein FVQ77_11690 [Cytophagales bacterium]|nr:hypothetical protein [Cytophagales bacterium]